ncbi:VOC family protein [Rhodococcus wratislaviensis]|nr:VOC family protein [Rhodococcus wratislaviensis]
MNHVGVTVSDLEKAIDWYVNVFGLELMDGPIDASLATVGASRRQEVFGPNWTGMRLAHLMTANGTGLELFEFVGPPVESLEDNFTYWRVGPHHIALTVADFDAALQRLLDAGGTQRTGVHDVFGGAYVCYCSDPWGNTVELVSKSYRELSNATMQP